METVHVLLFTKEDGKTYIPSTLLLKKLVDGIKN